MALPSLNSPLQTLTHLAELGTLVQAVVVVLVLGAEGCVVVIDEGVISHAAAAGSPSGRGGSYSVCCPEQSGCTA